MGGSVASSWFGANTSQGPASHRACIVDSAQGQPDGGFPADGASRCGRGAQILRACHLRAYPVYTVIAEKYHAMALLGLANTRMKDFYDVAVIAHRTQLDGATLARAIGATFARRQTPLPSGVCSGIGSADGLPSR